MTHTLPPLPYATGALEPYIDQKTMEVHHGKHHRGYVHHLNKAIEGTTLANQPLEEILRIRNNGGGHYNHTLFWEILSPKSSSPGVELLSAIEQQWGTLETFQEQFTQAAITRFGSGWAWLCVGGSKELHICSTPNQDNPLMDTVPAEHWGVPILCLDVWEHAYYLQYQNRRSEYVTAFWNVVNWEEVACRFTKAMSL